MRPCAADVVSHVCAPCSPPARLGGGPFHPAVLLVPLVTWSQTGRDRQKALSQPRRLVGARTPRV